MERTEQMTSAAAPATEQNRSYFDWPAIFGGVVVAVGIGIVFLEFGAALGLSLVSPLEGEGEGGWALILVGAWMLITTILAYAAGGYIAGRMRRRIDNASADEVKARDSLQGAAVWGLSLIATAWIALSAASAITDAAGNALAGAADAVSGAAQGAASVGQGMASSDVIADINPLEIINQRLLRGTGVQVDQNPELPDGAMAVLGEVVRTGEVDEGDRDYLARAIAANSNINRSDAEARVDTAVQEVQQFRQEAADAAAALEEEAREAADAARRFAVLGAFAEAAALLLAAIAAIWGASLGGRHRDEGRLFAGFNSI